MKKGSHSINVQEYLLSDGSMSSELKEILKSAAAEMKKNAVDHHQPPWTAFPEYKRNSIGWRMGRGEDYWLAFHSWVRSMDGQDLEAFLSKYPEPEDWNGFYDSFRLSN